MFLVAGKPSWRRFAWYQIPQPGVDADHVEHQRVSLPMSGRVAIERGIRILWMLRGSCRPCERSADIRKGITNRSGFAISSMGACWLICSRRGAGSARLIAHSIRVFSGVLRVDARLEGRLLLRRRLGIELLVGGADDRVSHLQHFPAVFGYQRPVRSRCPSDMRGAGPPGGKGFTFSNPPTIGVGPSLGGTCAEAF